MNYMERGEEGINSIIDKHGVSYAEEFVDRRIKHVLNRITRNTSINIGHQHSQK